MDFLSRLFGGGNSDGSKCNPKLRKHLKECAGLGQLPPLIQGCENEASAAAVACPPVDACVKSVDNCAAPSDNCANQCEQVDPLTSLAGPPTCKGCTQAPPFCCPPAPVKIKVFHPNPTIPTTMEFHCPESPCIRYEDKPRCEEKPPECDCPHQTNCPIIEKSGGNAKDKSCKCSKK